MQLLLITFSNTCQKRFVKKQRQKKCSTESFSSSQGVQCSQFMIPIFFSTTFVAINWWTKCFWLGILRKQDFQQTLQYDLFLPFWTTVWVTIIIVQYVIARFCTFVYWIYCLQGCSYSWSMINYCHPLKFVLQFCFCFFVLFFW